MIKPNYSDLPHRALAAFLAASERSSAVIFAALAFPPLSPPKRPSATAAGFFFDFSFLGASPVASCTIWKARRLGSVGRLRDRSGMHEG